MSRWFRFYDDTLNDPKTLKLADKTYRIWVGILCAASKNEGILPPIDDLAILLRMKAGKLQPEIEKLVAAALIDRDANGMRPHNWKKRQYNSDVSTERVKRFRNAGRNVSETPPDTEADPQTEKNIEVGANAPRDIRRDLFDSGLKTLARITGKTPDSCRSLVGKWLKCVNDEAIHVLGAIQDAERNRVADPVAWINQALKPKQGTPNGQANPNGLAQVLASLGRHVGEDDRGEERREPPPRLLSHG